MKAILYLALIFIFSAGLLRAQDTLTLHVDVAELTSAEKVYNFYYDNFDHVVGHQFALGYDTAGMTFREVRAFGSVHLSPANFNEPAPGEIRSVFINPTLDPEDLDNPFVAFQLVFDVKTPGGSALCLTTNPFDFQFILMEGNTSLLASHVRFYDDCHQPLVLGLQVTSTEIQPEVKVRQITALHISSGGQVQFESASPFDARILIHEADGRLVADLGKRVIVEGRQQASLGKPLLPGIYTISFITKEYHRETVRCVVVD